MILGHGCESPRIEWIEFDVENLFALILVSHNRLLVVALPRITKLDLVLCRINELVLAFGEPSYRVYVICDIWEGLMTFSDNFGTQACLYLA